MPELPDITLYVDKLSERLVGETLESVRVYSMSVLKTVQPAVTSGLGHKVVAVGRLGKRVWWEMDDGVVYLTHLMISGRFLWRDDHPEPPKLTNKAIHWVMQFSSGELQLTEVSSKKRASLHLLSSRAELAAHDRGGIDVFETDLATFSEILKRENRTLKRALTNPAWFSGIGNAYSDEILHHARLSPLKQTRSLSDEEVGRLFDSCKVVLELWTEKLREEFKGKFPGKGKITAFRPDFAAHGKFGKPCPVCGKPIQRIRYADNETNYCAVCQNEGRLLADRSLSRLLKSDWPKNMDELE